jgi:hypothetical protein
MLSLSLSNNLLLFFLAIDFLFLSTIIFTDETAKWEKIAYLGIATCTLLAIYNLSKGHPHYDEPPVSFLFYPLDFSVFCCYIFPMEDA